jgi:glycosyltransferase involved in cell wall biosynthesis
MSKLEGLQNTDHQTDSRNEKGALDAGAKRGPRSEDKQIRLNGARSIADAGERGTGLAAGAGGAGAIKVIYLSHVGVLGGAELSLIDMVRGGGVQNHVVLMDRGPLGALIAATGAGVTVLDGNPYLAQFRRESDSINAVTAIPLVMKLAWKVSRLAAGYQIIWANSQKSFVVGCFAALLARRPLIWHMRDILSPDHFSLLNRKVVVLLANRFATRVITVSDAGRHSFIQAGGRADIATVVHNGIDSGEFDRVDVAASRSDLRRELGIGDAPLLGSFGRLTSWKGQHVLIGALKSLPGVHAVFVGDALFHETEYARSLHKLAADLGVADRAHFVSFRKNIPQLMSAVDIVIHNATAPEPFGRVIVEAMLSRRPIIATDAGGAREIITAGHDGILIPASDEPALAAAIRELIEDPARAVAMGNRGYETATDRFSLKSFLSNVERVKIETAGTVALPAGKASAAAAG